jgi:hypothetical protein
MDVPDLVGLLSEEHANPLKGACPTEARRDALGSRRTDMLVELPHEGNAELADLVV